MTARSPGDDRPAPDRPTSRLLSPGWPASRLPAYPLDVALVLLAALAAGSTFHRAFGVGPLVPLVPLAALVPAALLLAPVAVPGRPRRYATAPLGESVLHLLVAGLGVVLLAAGVTGWDGLLGAVRDGPWQLLAITLPAPARPGFLAVPAVLTWLAVTAGIALARRWPGRLLSLLPAGLVAGYGLLLAGPHPPSDAAAVLVLLGCAATLVLRAAAAATTRIVAATAALLGVALALAAAAPLVPPRAEPVRVRDWIAVPAVVRPGIDPLDRLAGWLSTPDRVLFTGRADGPVSAWRLAVLPRYDGQRWSAGDGYVRAGLGVPADPDDRMPARLVRQEVVLDGLEGPFLPAAGRPVEIDAPVTAVDPATGVLVGPAAFRPGLAYRVGSRLPATEPPPEPPSVRPGRTEPTAPDGSGETLTVPAELRAALDALIAAAGVRPDQPPYEAALALTGHLRASYPNLPAEAGGTTVESLRRFLAHERPGNTIMHAQALALAMRRLAVPSRLVVGFAAEGADGVVRGRDARAWVELRFAGAGWLPFHPTPPPGTRQDPDAPAPPPPPTVAPPASPTPWLVAGCAPPVPCPPPPAGFAAGLPWRPLLLVALLAGAGYLAAVLAVPTLRRRYRRRAGGPERRVVAAWHDLLDELADRHGLGPALVGATPAGVRRLAAARLPASPLAPAGFDRPATPAEPATLRNAAMVTDVATSTGPATIVDLAALAESAALAALARDALFAGRPVTPAEATAAWRAADRIRRQLRAGQPWWRRWRGRLGPGNLRPGTRWR